MTRPKGKVLEMDVFNDGGDTSDEEEDPPRGVSQYDPHVGMAQDLRLGEYAQALKDRLVRDGMWGKTSQEQVQLAIDRLKVLDPAWASLKWQQHHPEDNRVQSNTVANTIKTQVMTVQEWNDLFCGIGGWMLPRRKRQAERRQTYELDYQFKRTDQTRPELFPGRTAKENGVDARDRWVGKTGQGSRQSQITRPLPVMEATWTFEGELRNQ